MINRGGPSLVVRIADQTGATSAAIASAFAAVRNSFDMPALNDEINALDNKVPGKVQLELYEAVQNLLLDRLVWFLRNVDLSEGLANVVDHYREGIEAVAAALDGLPQEAMAAGQARAKEELSVAGVPDALARRIADLAGSRGGARRGADRRPHAASRSPRSSPPISRRWRTSGSTA